MAWSSRDDWGDGWHAEVAAIDLGADGLSATGTQLGAAPRPYRLEYALDATAPGFVTRTLAVSVRGADWNRQLRLERDPDGVWSAEASGDGAHELGSPGGDTASLNGAVDCDLGFCPVTNTMPVRRHSLHSAAGKQAFLMAWVSVPDLAFYALAQRYTHLERTDDGAVVRYESIENGEAVFTAELQLDADGLVVLYPGLAERVAKTDSPRRRRKA